MGAWLAKYWLEVLFGFIVAGIGLFFKYFWKLFVNDRKQHDKELIDTISVKMDNQKESIITIINERDQRYQEEDNRLHNELNELRDDFKIMKGGILSIQGRDFKADCRVLLQKDHTITLNEYEAILEAHSVYKSLGGNHEGDALFSMVKAKYQTYLSAGNDPV